MIAARRDTASRLPDFNGQDKPDGQGSMHQGAQDWQAVGTKSNRYSIKGKGKGTDKGQSGDDKGKGTGQGTDEGQSRGDKGKMARAATSDGPAGATLGGSALDLSQNEVTSKPIPSGPETDFAATSPNHVCCKVTHTGLQFACTARLLLALGSGIELQSHGGAALQLNNVVGFLSWCIAALAHEEVAAAIEKKHLILFIVSLRLRAAH